MNLTELQTLIEAHFESRKKEEEELINLTQRIVRHFTKILNNKLNTFLHNYLHGIHAEGNELRGQRSRCTATTNTDKRGGPKKQTEREKKKTILSERRKELNVENLSADKLRETANELWKWMRQLEAEKFELQYRYMCQKYEVRFHKTCHYVRGVLPFGEDELMGCTVQYNYQLHTHAVTPSTDLAEQSSGPVPRDAA
uniref:Troponin T type 2b (cardiac) n=1 Tax=Sinocyclocheilus grahami TaxID=75366 RepID=A0A672N473_SINGR